MALKIKNLEQISQEVSKKDYYFKDLHLDINKSDGEYNIYGKFHNTNDIQADYDLAAIYNSLRNLFNTKPGQRFLFPKYGLDLNSYLFEPITEENAESLALNILQTIETYEPRVKVVDVQVSADPDQMQYDITIAVAFPIFDTVESFKTSLSPKTQNFVFINTTRS